MQLGYGLRMSVSLKVTSLFLATSEMTSLGSGGKSKFRFTFGLLQRAFVKSHVQQGIDKAQKKKNLHISFFLQCFPAQKWKP